MYRSIYGKTCISLRPTSQGNYESTLVLHGKNAFSFPVEEITIQEWFEFLDQIKLKHSAITARTLLVKLKTCLKFCMTRGVIENSTIFNIAPKSVGKKSEPKDRVPELSEIKTIMQEVDKSKCFPSTRNALKLIILTGARLSEVRRMELQDLDFKKMIWTVPREKSKTKKKIIRPITKEAFKLIKWQLDTFSEVSKFVFPSGSYKNEISTQTINKLNRLIRSRLLSIPSWTPHDFRRSISTILSRNKVRLEVTETMLGHSLGGIIPNYNYYDWVAEQKDAYELWEDLIFNELKE